MKKVKRIKTLSLLSLVFILCIFLWQKHIKNDALIVYCAHDCIYSQKILKIFEEETGIKVIPKFDTEASKSLGLIELIKSEKENPRCDVFWNNEALGMLDLERNNLLIPYKGANYKRIKPQFKDSQGYWTGFAGRMRVYIINTEKLQPHIQNVNHFLKDKNDLRFFSIAKPLYGTTLTHFCYLWKELGEEKLKKQYEFWKNNKVRIVNGNSVVSNYIASGFGILGWTDTDDFFKALDSGNKVAMLPILINNQAIIIPNTVGIIKNTKHLTKSKRLVDFLLSERCELLLSKLKSRQIPLGEINEDYLNSDVKKLYKWIPNSKAINKDLLSIRDKCIQYLKESNNNF